MPSQDLFQQAVDLFSQRISDYADGIAQRLGQPMSGAELTQQQVLERWNFTPVGNAQQADLQYHNLVAQGMPPGQALDQVYPFRRMLLNGPDLNSQIATARKIAGWDAAAKGQPEPETPDPQSLPQLHWATSMLNQQQGPPQPPPQQGPMQGPPMQGPPGPPMGPPLQGPPPGPPMMGPPQPPVAPGEMPPVQPVPGVSA